MSQKKLVNLVLKIGLTGCSEYYRLGILSTRDWSRVKKIWYAINMN